VEFRSSFYGKAGYSVEWTSFYACNGGWFYGITGETAEWSIIIHSTNLFSSLYKITEGQGNRGVKKTV
jgi:hypothetical protein